MSEPDYTFVRVELTKETLTELEQEASARGISVRQLIKEFIGDGITADHPADAGGR